MSVISAAIITKAADFVAKVGIELYVKWHFGGSHERAERYRARLERIKLAKELKNERQR